MQRQLKETAAGLGEITFIPELDSETAELERAFPKDLPAGVVHGYRWTEGGKLVAYAEIDPTYKAPAMTPPADAPAYQPVPSRDKLATWSINDLVTRGAELSVPHIIGETKAAFIARIVPAWEKANAAIDAAIKKANAGK